MNADDGNLAGPIEYEEALRVAQGHLDRANAEALKLAELRKNLTAREREILCLGAPEDDCLEMVIVESATIEGEFGWVFFYDSRKYIETGDDAHAIVGNAPLLVSRADGSLHVTGTALPPEDYIENFKRTGSPHG